MAWSLIDSATYHLLRGMDPGITADRLVKRLGASGPEAGRAVLTAQRGIACAAFCAGRNDEPIDLSGVPVNRAIPDNTYRFLVGVGISGREDREVVVDVTYRSPGRGRSGFFGLQN